ncbi:MAG: tRNA/rRNA methyltransferase [Bacteroidales bacterium]|nr:tRNA/rRNA methyltransferase [Bacteroidales bacterium]MBN2764360.1 tRNA/rRNA methyltransferase [Bacteroidales bacterium]
MDIFFILVEPAVPENVGATARAIKTMSFNELRLVNPCDYLSKEARMLAHGSGEILESSSVFSSLEEAITDIDFVIGTSAKPRRVKHDLYPVDQLCNIIKNKGNTINSIGVVFGREEYGLSNKEAQLCDIISYIPMAARYPSLNLSHAVMIFAYELLKMNAGGHPGSSIKEGDLSFRAVQGQLENILSSLGIKSNETLYNRILERINIAGEEDLHLLCSVGKYFERSKTKD